MEPKNPRIEIKIVHWFDLILEASSPTLKNFWGWGGGGTRQGAELRPVSCFVSDICFLFHYRDIFSRQKTHLREWMRLSEGGRGFNKSFSTETGHFSVDLKLTLQTLTMSLFTTAGQVCVRRLPRLAHIPDSSDTIGRKANKI